VTFSEYVLLCTISAFAGFTQGVTGFGSVLVALPLLTFFLSIKMAAPLANLISLGVSAYLCVYLRRSLSWRHILPLALSSLPGIWLGALLLQNMPAAALESILGLVLMLLSVYGALRLQTKEIASGWAYLAGFTSGLLGGSIGAYGPPVIVYAALQPWDSATVKSTMVGYFSLASIGILAFHTDAGFIDGDILRLSALALPFLGLGAWAGTLLYERIDAALYKRGILCLLFLLGVATLMKRL
jgi:uncharacterized membrane protein YfcA